MTATPAGGSRFPATPAGAPTQYRASFDAAITFGNGGDLTVHGFRVDLPGPDTGEAEIAALFVASLGLLMTDGVELANVRVFAEPHKGTRGGPSDRREADSGAAGEPVELGGAEGARFTPPRTDTGGGPAELPLARVADLPAVVVRVAGAESPHVDVGALAAFDVRGRAVLLHTGARAGHPLTAAGAKWLAGQGVALVGTDADRVGDGDPEPGEILLAAGVPVVEGLTGLDLVPPTGATFTAVPPRNPGPAQVPVRAYARIP
ncbi:cyclase family protein [Nonomuraea sp. NN258]|uniref:cyclase family protein n=1 Tax=Nonomuraea antri TaxID=2730852 RepID=UPI0015687736|nr:cyclase family protein [Nonomuraea antri]NRQ32062.1 cyclase family protein [Nonomuraea antri]